MALVLAQVTIRMYDFYMVGPSANVFFAKTEPAKSMPIIKNANTSDTRKSGSGGGSGEL